jgi:diguanylate cyclase (GGDEF)-like protein
MALIETAFAGLAEAVNELARAIYSDDKTPLENGLALRGKLKAVATEAEESVVVFGDLNGFKAINDSYGHAAGDAAIDRVGNLLATTLTAFGASGYRQSGDEFVVVGARSAMAGLAAAITAAFANVEVQFGGVTFAVRASFGWACADRNERPEVWLERAERACREAKKRSPGAVVEWDPDLPEDQPERRSRCNQCGCAFRAIPTIAISNTFELFCPQCGQREENTAVNRIRAE